MNWPFSKQPTHLSPELLKKFDAFLNEVKQANDRLVAGQWRVDLKAVTGAESALLGGEQGACFLMELAERLARKNVKSKSGFYTVYSDYCVDQVIEALNRRKPKFSEEQIARLVELNKATEGWFDYNFRPERVAGYALATAEREGLTRSLRASMEWLIRDLANSVYGGVDSRRMYQALRNTLDGVETSAPALDQTWQKPFEGHGLLRFALQASKASGNKPSKKWLEETQAVLKSKDSGSFIDAFEKCLTSVRGLDQPVDAMHSDMLRGLCWMMGLTGHPRAAFLLGQMLLACGHKLSGWGARSQKGFSGCVDALARMDTTEALAELSKVRAKIKTPSLAENLLKTLTQAAEKQGLPMAELEELVVPGFGLELPGVKTLEMGELKAELKITGTTTVDVEWSRLGKPLKSKPTVPEQWKADANELTKEKKEIESSLSAQKQRIEALYYIERSWPYSTWRERYIDHPLLANMSRRLIWSFESNGIGVEGMAPEGTILRVDAKPLLALGVDTIVRLWHPLDSEPATVEAWREFLFTNEIRQPFKQAHREVYVLTDAELNTDVYSNRFAAHVLRQHQMAALMRNRGWKYALMGGYDFHNTPTLPLPESELRAQFWVDVPAFVWEQVDYMTESGTGMYVTTDQVCFVTPGEERVPLDQIPRKIFSEVLRDVDLFVGVASVGNDPNWRDQGQRLGYGQYWQDVSFGNLSATAETRKSVLQRLLPKLAIASASKIDGKFLIVKGKLRTYKIHLGSGNILMEPNDQYLCIVPSGGGVGKDSVFLPFEGDATMAIILSKAMMLAKDTEIKDATITSQIKRR